MKKNQVRGADEIKRMQSLYEEGKSFSEVGEIFGISPPRVEQIFRLNNITTRRKTVSKKFLAAMGSRRIILDKDLLVRLYTEEKLSIRKIADDLNTSRHVVYRNLQIYKIPTRPIENYDKSRLTPELLRRLYIDENLTAAMIAERLKFSLSAIGRKLSEFGIKKSVAIADSVDSEQFLKSEYAVTESESPEALTVDEIAEKYQMHPDSVRKLVRSGFFPNGFRQRVGKTTLWMIPIIDLKNFAPRRKGSARTNEPTLLAIHSRGRYARTKIKNSHGYGRAEIEEMVSLEKHNLTRMEIAIRFRLDERIVADILDEIAVRKPQREKRQSVKKEPKRLPEQLLRDLYVNGEFSTAYILEKLDTNYASLYISLRHYGIPLRGEHFRQSAQEKEHLLYQLSVEDELPPDVIADRLKLTVPYVKRKIKELKRRLQIMETES